MSQQQPIFRNGLFGAANASVCNAWTESAALVQQNADGLAWASAQLVQGAVEQTWLATLEQAIAIPNTDHRWKYRFRPFLINLDGNDAVPQDPLAGTFGKTPAANAHEDHAFNIRELRNTLSEIDGSPLPANGTAGPVGSTFASGGWSLAALEGYVWMHLSYDIKGRALFWFDCPNPVACPPEQPQEPPPGGGE